MKNERQTLINRFNHLLNKNNLHGIKYEVKFIPSEIYTTSDCFTNEPFDIELPQKYEFFIKPSDFPNGIIPTKFVRHYWSFADKWYNKYGTMVFLVDAENNIDIYDRDEF